MWGTATDCIVAEGEDGRSLSRGGAKDALYMCALGVVVKMCVAHGPLPERVIWGHCFVLLRTNVLKSTPSSHFF